MKYALILFSLIAGSFVAGYIPEDQVTDLPGLDYEIGFDQWSGYLTGTPGRQLHYWFTESQGNKTTDPILLWLNGGPGCSSLEGLLSENGPFKVNPDGSNTLLPNEYSWNLNANVLFLESPACVGFSYDENNNCVTGDSEVAEMNYLALQNFFSQYEEYLTRPFFITGESYAGVYIPTLVEKVVDGLDTFPLNFQGYAIGNGLLSYENNENSLFFFGKYHALLGQTLWDNLVTRCCGGVESQETCDFYNFVSPACEVDVIAAINIIYYQGLNIYNLYQDCLSSDENTTSTEYTFAIRNLFRRLGDRDSNLEPYSDPICTDSSLERGYLNQPDVRAALHIPEFVQDWELCSDPVFDDYVREYSNTTSIISSLQSRGYRGLIYNGDVDMAVNFLGNEWDVGTLGLTQLESRARWMVNNDVAGYVVSYENLDFVTVRGSGHMVPEDKPAEALQMITAFINNEPY